jgi:hypothetical protein
MEARMDEQTNERARWRGLWRRIEDAWMLEIHRHIRRAIRRSHCCPMCGHRYRLVARSPHRKALEAAAGPMVWAMARSYVPVVDEWPDDHPVKRTFFDLLHRHENVAGTLLAYMDEHWLLWGADDDGYRKDEDGVMRPLTEIMFPNMPGELGYVYESDGYREHQDDENKTRVILASGKKLLRSWERTQAQIEVAVERHLDDYINATRPAQENP